MLLVAIEMFHRRPDFIGSPAEKPLMRRDHAVRPAECSWPCSRSPGRRPRPRRTALRTDRLRLPATPPSRLSQKADQPGWPSRKAAASSLTHSSAAAPITCSQLSTTSTSCCRASTRTSISATETPGCSRTPSIAATAAVTCAPSCTSASSASHAPSANRASIRRATSPASRVLPTAPGPVTVTSRCSSSRAATSRTGLSRPMKLVSAAGKPCTPPVAAGAADTPTPVP